jgi:hypothetical protein
VYCTSGYLLKGTFSEIWGGGHKQRDTKIDTVRYTNKDLERDVNKYTNKVTKKDTNKDTVRDMGMHMVNENLDVFNYGMSHNKSGNIYFTALMNTGYYSPAP